jgi:hypothetical protein
MTAHATVEPEQAQPTYSSAGHDGEAHAHATMDVVDKAVDSCGYVNGIVDENAIRGGVVCKPVDTWGRRYTRGSVTDLQLVPWMHNPQDRRRKRDLSARMTGDL